MARVCFGIIQNNIALKHQLVYVVLLLRFGIIQNNIALKRVDLHLRVV